MNRQEKKRSRRELLKITPINIVKDGYFMKTWGKTFLRCNKDEQDELIKSLEDGLSDDNKNLLYEVEREQG